MRRGKVQDYSKGTGCDNRPPPSPLHFQPPLWGKTPSNPGGNLPSKLILPWELFRHGLCALISLFHSSVGVWMLWLGAVVRCSSVLRGLRVFSVWLLFEVFGKCGARPAHEQQVSPHALLECTFCLCVHYELFLPRVRWVQTNLIFCLYQFLDWLLTFVWTITSLVPVVLLSLKDSPVDILEPSVLFFNDPNTLLLFWLFLSYHCVRSAII